MDIVLPAPKRVVHSYLDGECFPYSPPTLKSLAAYSAAGAYPYVREGLRPGCIIPWRLNKQIRDRVIYRALDYRSVERPSHVVIASARLALNCLLIEELGPPFHALSVINLEESWNGYSGLRALCEFLWPFARELKRLAAASESRSIRWFTDFNLEPTTGCRFSIDAPELHDGPAFNYFWETTEESPFKTEGGYIEVDETGQIQRVIKTEKSLRYYLHLEEYLKAPEGLEIEFLRGDLFPARIASNIEGLIASLCY